MRILWFLSLIVIVNSSLNFNFLASNNYNKNKNNYDNVIATANIFYINPNPRSNVISVNIDQLPDVQNKKEIKIIIHGYYADIDHVAVAPLRYAYLAKGSNTLYMADCGQAARLFYPLTRNLTWRISTRLAQLLEKFLKRHNINAENVHLIGHSLGAHIAGVIGKYFRGRIGRITGLDPAFPLFKPNSSDALSANDAIFVDVIHTDGSILGDLTPRGHVDFYPNYGLAAQPGCQYLDILTFTSCSHHRACVLYAETIQLPNNFPSVKCDLTKIKSRQVSDCWNVNSSDVILMGENISKKAKGTYFLETNNVPPYGLGLYSKKLFQGYN